MSLHEFYITQWKKTAHKFRGVWQAHILLLMLGIVLGVTLGVTALITQTSPIVVSSPFTYWFKSPGILQESGSMGESTSPYFWLNSGGELIIQNGMGQTMQGDALLGSKWQVLYAKSNPLDTDGGLHPQNLFRLVTRSQWNNVREQIMFYIVDDHLSSSTNRNASNGILLMSRYLSGQTLYYAGVRVDGTAVIKKKINGVYYTMAQKKIFPGTYTRSTDTANLIPHKQWIGLRSETRTNTGGTVTITLSMQLPGESWNELLKVTDTGKNFGGAPITGAGYAGVRTDFMDVQFQTYRLEML